MPKQDRPLDPGRRTFLKTMGVGAAGVAAASAVAPAIVEAVENAVPPPGTAFLSLRVNGRERRVHLEPRTTLAELLRDHLGLTGTKVACNQGTCGTCTVLLDGRAVYACHTLALDAAGREVLTVEGLLDGEELHPLQRAFAAHDGLQCGFCTPGQVMAAAALLRENPSPDREEIRSAMAGNVCRCGAYPKIIESIEAAARS